MAKSIFSNLTDPAYQQQARRGQFYQGLGPLGAALIAAGQGGLQPGQRGQMVAQGLGQFSQQAFDPNMAQRMNIQGIQGQAAELELEKTRRGMQPPAYKPPAGYAGTAGTLTAIPGGPADPAVVESLRAPIKPPAAEKPVKDVEGRLRYPSTGKLAFPEVKTPLTPQERFEKMLGGGAGEDILGGAAGDIPGIPSADVVGGPKEPSMRDMFFALPREAQAGIRMAPDPMKAMSSYMLRQKGLDIQFNPDGTIKSMTQGGPAQAFGKKQTGTIQEKLFNAREGIARLQNVDNSFRPEFQETLPRLGFAWDAITERMGRTLDPTDKAELKDFSVYKMNALENINMYIKDVTGAQMSEAEAVRLRQGMPDPGDNWWSGDSPTEFKGKMDEKIKTLRSASARYVYALKNGWDMDPNNLEKALPLNKVEDLIEERGAALERQMRARRPDLSDSAVEGFVEQSLRAEFGVGQ